MEFKFLRRISRIDEVDDIEIKESIYLNSFLITACYLFSIAFLIFYFSFCAVNEVLSTTSILITLMPFILLSIVIVISLINRCRSKYVRSLIFTSCFFVCVYFYFFYSTIALIILMFPLISTINYHNRGYFFIGALFVFLCTTFCCFGSILFGYYDMNAFVYLKGITLFSISDLSKVILENIPDYSSQLSYVLPYTYLPTIGIEVFTFFILGGVNFRFIKVAEERQKMTNMLHEGEYQLRAGGELQKSMLTKNFPKDNPNFKLYSFIKPALNVGGDFYDFTLIDNNRLFFYVADVSGKGINAAIFMSNAKALLSYYLLYPLNLNEFLKIINHSLAKNFNEKMYLTGFFGVLDLKTGILTYLNAGHPFPIIIGEDNSIRELNERSGTVVGLFPNSTYKEFKTKINYHDRIFIFTDGVSDALNINKEQFGKENIINSLIELNQSTIENAVNTLYEKIATFSFSLPQFDDITMMMVSFENNINIFEKVYRANDKELPNLVDDTNDFLAIHNADLVISNKISLVVEEIFVNIAHYAYKGEEGDLFYTLTFDNGLLTMVFADNGVPFDPLQQKEPDFEKRKKEYTIGGLGIFIVRKIMDEVAYEYKNNQNVLTLKKKI